MTTPNFPQAPNADAAIAWMRRIVGEMGDTRLMLVDGDLLFDDHRMWWRPEPNGRGGWLVAFRCNRDDHPLPRPLWCQATTLESEQEFLEHVREVIANFEARPPWQAQYA